MHDMISIACELQASRIPSTYRSIHSGLRKGERASHVNVVVHRPICLLKHANMMRCLADFLSELMSYHSSHSSLFICTLYHPTTSYSTRMYGIPCSIAESMIANPGISSFTGFGPCGLLHTDTVVQHRHGSPTVATRTVMILNASVRIIYLLHNSFGFCNTSTARSRVKAPW